MYTAAVPRQFPPDLAECTGFEWDKGNNDKNWRKHRVSREEAEQVFSNRPLLLVLGTDETPRASESSVTWRSAARMAIAGCSSRLPFVAN